MANWKRWWGMIWNGNKRGDGIRRVGSWLVLGGCLDRWFELWLPCKRNISRPPFAQHSRYALGLSFCPARLPTSRCRQRAAALVRGVEAVPVASQPPCHRWFVDWRDGFISPWRWNWKKKMMFLNHRRLHQLEIGDGFFRYTSRGGHSKLRYVKI